MVFYLKLTTRLQVIHTTVIKVHILSRNIKPIKTNIEFIFTMTIGDRRVWTITLFFLYNNSRPYMIKLMEETESSLNISLMYHLMWFYRPCVHDYWAIQVDVRLDDRKTIAFF